MLHKLKHVTRDYRNHFKFKSVSNQRKIIHIYVDFILTHIIAASTAQSCWLESFVWVNCCCLCIFVSDSWQKCLCFWCDGVLCQMFWKQRLKCYWFVMAESVLLIIICVCYCFLFFKFSRTISISTCTYFVCVCVTVSIYDLS